MLRDDASSRRFIYRYTPDQGIIKQEDLLVKEKEFKLYLNEQYYESLLCSPINLDELTLGHLGIAGKINCADEVKSIRIINDKIMIYTKSMGAQPVQEEVQEKSYYIEDLLQLMERHLNSSSLHTATGGVHIMALASNNDLLVSREDIGRHNAVDKIYGYCLIKGLSCADKVFLSSGRLSTEIINKLSIMGIKTAVSRAAVTDMAMDFADRAGMTVVGFARGKRSNIYSHPERIKSRKEQVR